MRDPDLKKTQNAFELLCAFNGIEPEQCPAEFWWFHPNKWTRDAWLRVEEKALELYGPDSDPDHLADMFMESRPLPAPPEQENGK